MRSRRNITRYLAAGAVAVVAGFAVNGVTAANTVPTSKVGDGSGAVSGYTASSISYTLNGTSPQNVDEVSFTLDDAATEVQIKLVSGGSDWYTCTNPANNDWECVTTSPQATAAAINELRVVARSS